jgi:hypothetical protein
MSSKFKSVDLDALGKKQAGEVTLNGRVVPVLQVKGKQYHSIQQITQGTREDGVAAMFELAHDLLPGTTLEEVLELTKDQVGAVLAIATNNVDAVEALLNPNGETEAAGSK